MDSSQEFELSPKLLNPIPTDKNSEQLFDKVIQQINREEIDDSTTVNSIDDDDDDFVLEVQKPKKTYAHKRLFKTVKFMEDDGNDDVYETLSFASDNEQEEYNPQKAQNEGAGKKKTRKRNNRGLPNVSKEALLEAFAKAIEVRQLPNFDEIEKFPLSIVKEKKIKKKSNNSKKCPENITETNEVIDQENVNHSQNKTETKKKNISKKDSTASRNAFQSLSTNTPSIQRTSLFNLDESVIPFSGDSDETLIGDGGDEITFTKKKKNVKTNNPNQKKKVQCSTPQKLQKKSTPIIQKTRYSTRNRSKLSK